MLCVPEDLFVELREVEAVVRGEVHDWYTALAITGMEKISF